MTSRCRRLMAGCGATTRLWIIPFGQCAGGRSYPFACGGLHQIANRGNELRLVPVVADWVGEGSFIMNLKRIVAGAAMAGALGFTALGLGAGIANAEPAAPVVSGVAGQQDGGGTWGQGG